MLIFRPDIYCTAEDSFIMKLGTGIAGRQGSLAVALVAGGGCHVLDGGNAPEATAGDMLLIPAQATVSSIAGCTLEGLYLTGEAPKQAAQSMESAQVIPQASCNGADALLHTLLESGKAIQAHESGSLAYTLLCRLAAAQAAPAGKSGLVAAAVHMINESYGELYGIAELADELQVSKHHLIRCFTAEMGMPPGKYLTSIRVQNAKRLLMHRDFTLETVAGMCGFSGANYMCKVFRQQTGQSPAAWRASAAGTQQLRPIGRLEEQVYL